MDITSTLTDPKIVVALFLILCWRLYRYGTSTFHVFSEQGIPGPKPLPFIGNLWGVWKQNMMDQDMKMVKKYGKVFGVFNGLQPNVFITDVQLIKNIFLADYSSFPNHVNLQDPDDDRFFSVRKMPFFLRDKQWKEIRPTVSQAFTPFKIKSMSSQMKQSIDNSVLKLRTLAESPDKFDVKKFCTGMTFGILARCAFGLKIDSLCDPGDIFTEHASETYTDNEQSPSFLLPVLFPKWFNGDQVFLSPSWKFFVKLLTNIILQRSQSNQKYNDFLENMHEAISKMVETGQATYTDDQIVELVSGQALEVLTDGYEGTSRNLAFTIYSLAMHQNVQQKLYEEITAKIATFGHISFEMMQEMTYTEQVLKETLRCYPLLPRIDRECKQDVQYDGLHISKGMMVTFPAQVIHHLEEFYANPYTFDPDRWSDDNKGNIDPNTFLPFGLGPRGCPGTRFAMEQMKMAICTIVQQFHFFPTENTPEKVQFKNGFISMVSQTVNDLTVGLALR